MKYSRRCSVMRYRQNPLPIARRYRLLKSAKADGDVRIGKYPGLVSSPAQAFPDCSSDMICADSSLQWRDRFGFEEPLINSAPSSQHIFFALSASTNPPHSLCCAFGLSPWQVKKSVPIWRTSFYQRFLTEFQIKSLDAYFLPYSIFIVILMHIIRFCQ